MSLTVTDVFDGKLKSYILGYTVRVLILAYSKFSVVGAAALFDVIMI